MRVPVVVGIMGGVGAGKEAFSKTVQKYLSDKFKLTAFIVNERDVEDIRLEEVKHEESLDSEAADVIMVNGSSSLHDERHRTPIDFKVFLHSNTDPHMDNFVKNARGKVSLQDKYLTETDTRHVPVQRTGKHAHFLAKDNIDQDEMNVLGVLINDMCAKRGNFHVPQAEGSA